MSEERAVLAGGCFWGVQDLFRRYDGVLSSFDAGRGCPFPCRFCAAAQTRIQYRSGASARAELEHLIDTYRIDGFAIVDDNFIVNKHKVRDICTSIRDLHLSWSALSRVDTIDQALLQDMATSGCIEVKFGMESGSQALLKAMRKNTTQAQIRRAVAMAKQAGIKVKVFLIHGSPVRTWTPPPKPSPCSASCPDRM